MVTKGESHNSPPNNVPTGRGPESCAENPAPAVSRCWLRGGLTVVCIGRTKRKFAAVDTGRRFSQLTDGGRKEQTFAVKSKLVTRNVVQAHLVAGSNVLSSYGPPCPYS